MSERGWFTTVLDAAKADYDRWPDWMKQSSTSSDQGVSLNTKNDGSTSSGEIRCDEASCK
jgi:hypothetical protein